MNIVTLTLIIKLICIYFDIQGVVRQFLHALNSCSPQQFLEFGTLHQEMLQQEKALDFYVELLRKDQLDENVQLDALEKVVVYFNSIYAVQFSAVVNGAALLTDHAKILLAACCGLATLSDRVQSMLQVNLTHICLSKIVFYFIFYLIFFISEWPRRKRCG